MSSFRSLNACLGGEEGRVCVCVCVCVRACSHACMCVQTLCFKFQCCRILGNVIFSGLFGGTAIMMLYQRKHYYKIYIMYNYMHGLPCVYAHSHAHVHKAHTHTQRLHTLSDKRIDCLLHCNALPIFTIEAFSLLIHLLLVLQTLVYCER